MLQTQPDALSVHDEQDAQGETKTIGTGAHQEPQSHYARAEEFDFLSFEYPVPGFVNELLDTLGKDLAPEDARLLDTITPSKDIDDGMLVAFPDESLMFCGKDPTAADAMPWFAFTIEPMEPMPAPETAKDALDLLKPPEVKDTIEQEQWIPNRHGEWWLLGTSMVPTGTVHQPGVKTEPYGPSPLGNHVPREYAFTRSDDAFMGDFKANVDSAPASIQTVPEALQWTWRQTKKVEPPEDTPSWADIRTWARDVLVRGTIRHRDNDHFVEDCGDRWHKAKTHRVEVYTADALGENVHLDYYGQ